MLYFEKLKQMAECFRITEFMPLGVVPGEIAARVRGETPAPEFPDSDVDIGVQPEPGKRLSIQEKVKLAIELEDLLEVAAGRPGDYP